MPSPPPMIVRLRGGRLRHERVPSVAVRVAVRAGGGRLADGDAARMQPAASAGLAITKPSEGDGALRGEERHTPSRRPSATPAQRQPAVHRAMCARSGVAVSASRRERRAKMIAAASATPRRAAVATAAGEGGPWHSLSCIVGLIQDTMHQRARLCQAIDTSSGPGADQGRRTVIRSGGAGEGDIEDADTSGIRRRWCRGQQRRWRRIQTLYGHRIDDLDPAAVSAVEWRQAIGMSQRRDDGDGAIDLLRRERVQCLRHRRDWIAAQRGFHQERHRSPRTASGMSACGMTGRMTSRA